MTTTPAPVTDTGLRRGDAASIARRLGYSVQHVVECAKGERTAATKLAREIERMKARRAREAAAEERTAAVA